MKRLKALMISDHPTTKSLAIYGQASNFMFYNNPNSKPKQKNMADLYEAQVVMEEQIYTPALAVGTGNAVDLSMVRLTGDELCGPGNWLPGL